MYLDLGGGILATLGIKGGITLGSMGTRGSRIFLKPPYLPCSFGGSECVDYN